MKNELFSLEKARDASLLGVMTCMMLEKFCELTLEKEHCPQRISNYSRNFCHRVKFCGMKETRSELRCSEVYLENMTYILCITKLICVLRLRS